MVIGCAMRVAASVGAALVVCSVQSVCAQESKDIPERYSRQVAPVPSTYWRSPDLRDYTRMLKPTEAPLIDPNKRYELPELIDLAQRVNPETRVAWEAARRAALAVGLVESEYFPVLAISALGGYKSVGVHPEGRRLRWVLPLRPGPGGARVESAMAAARLRSPR
jgi:outer membrane protein